MISRYPEDITIYPNQISGQQMVQTSVIRNKSFCTINCYRSYIFTCPSFKVVIKEDSQIQPRYIFFQFNGALKCRQFVVAHA